MPYCVLFHCGNLLVFGLKQFSILSISQNKVISVICLNKWSLFSYCREADMTKERIEKLLKAGANVVLTTKGIDDMALKVCWLFIFCTFSFNDLLLWAREFGCNISFRLAQRIINFDGVNILCFTWWYNGRKRKKLGCRRKINWGSTPHHTTPRVHTS